MPESPTLINWPAERPAYESLDAAVQGEVARWNSVGMTAGVIHDGETRVSAAGFANLSAGYPMRPENIFIIASITKIYTTTLVLRLVEQGVLNLDTPVPEYLPDFRLSRDDLPGEITLRHLLSHTSGFDGDRFIEYGRGDDAYDKAVAEFATLTQWFRPGAMYSYNNAGFTLAGHIIQRVTGKAFDDVFEDELIAPMKLEQTTVVPGKALAFPMAVGHDVNRLTGVSVSKHSWLPRHTVAAGGVMQSVGDLLRFAQMHLNDGEIDGQRIISAEHAQLMRTPTIKADAPYRSYGLGWSIYERPEFTSVNHGGSWGGYRTQLILVPEDGFAIAMLGNGSCSLSTYESLEQWAVPHYLGYGFPEPESISLSPLELSAFAGRYGRHDGRYEVTVRGNGLRIAVTDIDEKTGKEEDEERVYDLEPTDARRFRVTSPSARGATVDFLTVPDAAGDDQDLLRISGRLARRG